jgi:probable rRNA maturation factor
VNRVDLGAIGVDEPAWLDHARAFAEKALAALGLDGWDLSIAFCGDDYIKALNGQYRGKDEATDVLSFEQGERYEDPALGERFLAGDILISLETLETNARYFGVERDEELKRLIVHGVLHLSGRDHPDNDPGREMLALQEKVLAGLSEESIL